MEARNTDVFRHYEWGSSTESYCISQGEFRVRPSSFDSETRLSFRAGQTFIYRVSRSRVYAFAVSMRYRSVRGITLRRLMSTIGILSLFGTTQILGILHTSKTYVNANSNLSTIHPKFFVYDIHEPPALSRFVFISRS